MSDEVDAVKRALRALVVDRESNEATPPDVVVERAETAATNVRAAARYVEDDGFAELERAVRVAETREKPTLAERGHAVLDAIDAYRTVAADHFRPGREGLMGGEQVVSDETT